MIVLVEPSDGAGTRRGILVDGEEHHLRVRRAREGEAVEVRDGAGLVGAGRLVRDSGGWRVDIESERQVHPLPGLTLAVAAGDRGRFEWLVEKSVELGATRIVPLETELTAGVASRLRPQHAEKLQTRAWETLKQCGAAWMPAIMPAVSLGDFLREARQGLRWLADAVGAPPPEALDATPVTVLVGPEGGFSEGERAAILAAGYRPICLGPHILRFETAAIAAAAAVASARHRGHHE